MKKYLFSMAAAIAIGVVSYFYISQQFIADKPAQMNAVVALQQEQQNAAIALQHKQKIATPSIAQSNSSVSGTGAWGRKLTATEMAVKSEWIRRTGGTSKDIEPYEHYSDAQLEEMVNKGNIYAMAVLGTRKLAEIGVGAAVPYAEKAIVHGSLSGITSMAIYVAPEDDSQPYEEIKKQLMESQAYYVLHAMRGDPYGAKGSKDTQLKFFKEKHKLNTVFDAEDETWIKNRAQELYNKYQAERNKLGLGDFDNEMPREVKTFFDPKKE